MWRFAWAFLPQGEAHRDGSSDMFAEWTWPPMLWMTLMRWGEGLADTDWIDFG